MSAPSIRIVGDPMRRWRRASLALATRTISTSSGHCSSRSAVFRFLSAGWHDGQRSRWYSATFTVSTVSVAVRGSTCRGAGPPCVPRDVVHDRALGVGPTCQLSLAVVQRPLQLPVKAAQIGQPGIELRQVSPQQSLNLPALRRSARTVGWPRGQSARTSWAAVSRIRRRFGSCGVCLCGPVPRGRRCGGLGKPRRPARAGVPRRGARSPLILLFSDDPGSGALDALPVPRSTCRPRHRRRRPAATACLCGLHRDYVAAEGDGWAIRSTTGCRCGG